MSNGREGIHVRRAVRFAQVLSLGGLLVVAAGLVIGLGQVSTVAAADEPRAQHLTSNSSVTTWAVEQIVADTNAESSRVSADGDYISWASFNSVFLHDLRSGTTMEIFSTSGRTHEPAVHGRLVVWAASDSFRGPFHVHVFDIEAGETIRLPHDAEEVDVDDGRVVWAALDGVYLYDSLTDEISLIGPGEFPGSPQIVGRYVVWDAPTDLGQGEPANWEVFLYDLETQEARRLTTDASNDFNPRLSDSHVVWVRDGAVALDGFEICLHCLDSGQTEELTDDAVCDDYPQVSGDAVVWTKTLGDTYDSTEIHVYDARTRKTARLTDNEFADGPPVISGHLVVWSGGHQPDDPGGLGDDLYVYDMETESLSRIPRGSPEELQPVIADGRLFWIEYGDDGYSLFAAAVASIFSDVSLSPYRVAIEDLATLGVIGGYGDGTFRPKNPLLRAQFAKIVAGALGFVATEGLTSPFVDLGVDDLFDLYPHEFVALSWMKGITLGKTATTFEPFRPVLRAQAISMAVRGIASVLPGALTRPENWYSSTWGDFDPNHNSNVRLAEHNGLLSGLPLAHLDPWGAMTREEAAQLLNNARVFLAQAVPATVRGTASDPALVAAIRTGWPELGDLFLPTELPQGWRLSDASLGFGHVPMSGPPDIICAYGVQYTNGQEAIELSAGYWPASGGSRYFLELAEIASPVDIFLEGDQWKTFAYRDYPTEAPTHQVLFVETTNADGEGNGWYVEIDYSLDGAQEAAEEIARAIVRVP